MTSIVDYVGSEESDWYFEDVEENKIEYRGRRSRWDDGSDSGDSESDGETIASMSTIESVESESSMGSFIRSDGGESMSGRLSAGLLGQLGGQLRDVGNIFNDFWERYNRIHGDFRRKIVSSIVDVKDRKGFKRIFPTIIEGFKKCTFGAICFHDGSSGHSNGPHVHIIHDCPWHSERCKCFKLLIRKRNGRQHSTGEGSALYINSVLEYYSKDPRWLCYVKIGERHWSTVVSNKSIQYEGHQRSPVHGSSEEGDNISTSLCRAERPTSYQIAVSSGRPKDGFGREGSSRKAVPRSLESFILEYPTFPVINIMETGTWQQSEYRYLMGGDRVLQRALQAVQVKYMNMTYQQYVEYYSNIPASHLYFSRRNTLMHDFYFDVDKSLELIEEVLTFHMNPDGESPHLIGEFFQNVYDIIEKRLPKKNTLYIVGQPSSGKNFIIDSLASFLINVGNIANYNKNSQFPFNDCKSRRLLIWNEPNFMDSATDTLKMATGGDPLPCNIKNQGHYIMPRTPIIIMSNKDVFKPHKNLAYQERFISYINWSPLPWPKVDKKPHPYVWMKAFTKYECEI